MWAIKETHEHNIVISYQGAPFVADPSVSFQTPYNTYAPQPVPGSLGTYPGPAGGTWGGSLNATGPTLGQHPIPPNPGFIPPPSATTTYSGLSHQINLKLLN